MAAEIAQSTPAHAVFDDTEMRDIERVTSRVTSRPTGDALRTRG